MPNVRAKRRPLRISYRRAAGGAGGVTEDSIILDPKSFIFDLLYPTWALRPLKIGLALEICITDQSWRLTDDHVVAASTYTIETVSIPHLWTPQRWFTLEGAGFGRRTNPASVRVTVSRPGQATGSSTFQSGLVL